MTVTPVEGEPGRFHVPSDTDGLPWLVDLNPGPDLPLCACAIAHNRKEKDWHCKHIRAAVQFVLAQSSPASSLERHSGQNQ